MRQDFTFVIPGKPTPLQRARAHNGRVVDTPRNRLTKHTIAQEAALVMRSLGIKTFTGPVTIEVYFCFEQPKRNKYPYHVSRPDIDNLLKMVLDGLNGVAFADDAQVWHVTMGKQYGQAATVVRVTQICTGQAELGQCGDERQGVGS